MIAGAQSTRAVSLPMDIQKVKAGTLTKCTPSSRVNSSQEGQASERRSSQCFFTAVNPMCARQDLEGVECDLDKLRIAPYKHTWKAHHNSSNLDHDWKSNKSWDSWQTSSWTELFFKKNIFLLSNRRSAVDRYTFRTPHFLIHSRCTDCSPDWSTSLCPT